jgi:D-alanine-D-alanine ligase-like ATP-grasp enzyme
MLYLCKTVIVKMSKKKVGVVCGGFSSEFEISIQSGKTVVSNLDRTIYEETYLITIDSGLDFY